MVTRRKAGCPSGGGILLPKASWSVFTKWCSWKSGAAAAFSFTSSTKMIQTLKISTSVKPADLEEKEKPAEENQEDKLSNWKPETLRRHLNDLVANKRATGTEVTIREGRVFATINSSTAQTEQ